MTIRSSTVAPAFFYKALGINTANVSATAKAVAVPAWIGLGAAPFAIYYTQRELARHPASPASACRRSCSTGKSGRAASS